MIIKTNKDEKGTNAKASMPNHIINTINKLKLNQNNKRNSAITLIALVITIIVLLILAGISLSLVFGENGLIKKAEEGKFKTKMSAIAESWEMYIGDHYIKGQITEGIPPNEKELYAGELLKEIIIEDELDLEEVKVQDIRKLIPEVGSKEEKYVIIHEGELYYVSQSNMKNNENQTKWCEEIGIKIWEYTPSNSGIKVVTGAYEYVNGIYMCTPVLTKGFVKEKTRYMKEKDGNLIATNWINKKPDDDWYDYKNQKWANIHVESSGLESYYVWIPRYVYKTLDNERIDTKFVDLNNNYKDGETDAVTTWEQLQQQGYKIPEAFYYGDNENYLENTPLPGYWVAKYQLSELKDEDTYTIDFGIASTPTTMTIQDIVINEAYISNLEETTGRKVAKYQYAVNGKILHESSTPENYKITGLARGNKAVNVTIIDQNGEIIGSMTKLYEVADVNPPDLTGFDPDTTFYVYWDENGVEHNEIPISKPEPDEWYDYTTRSWANILTRNNGLESYYVWIPRYQYTLDTVSQRTYVKFIKGLGKETDTGYQIPEAFTWTDGGENSPTVELSGYWVAKYQLSSEEATPRMTAEMSAGGDKIRIKDITGSKIAETGQKYEYYINGDKVHEGTSPTENYIYTNLKPNLVYTVTILTRDKNTNEYIAGVTRKIETVGANKPVLKGFNENNTYYVLYETDSSGNEVEKIGEKIKNDGSNAPANWYEYSERRWANIVITDGKVENGEIKDATSTTYAVWVPRYQYSLDTVNQRTNVKFIDGVGTDTQAGYRIPEAFTWTDGGADATKVELPGYWVTKYQLSN